MYDVLYSVIWVGFPAYCFINFEFTIFLLSLFLLYLLFYQFPKLFGLEPMRASDSLFLMDSPTNKLLVTSIAIFGQKLSLKQYKNCVRKALSADPRTQKCVYPFLGRFYWKKDPDFNESNHYTVISKRHNKSSLQNYINKILTQDLPPNRPPYEIHFFKDYEGYGSAVVFRFHHVFADGLAIVSMMTWCADEGSSKIFYSPPEISLVKKILIYTISVITFLYYNIELLIKPKNNNALNQKKLSGVKTIAWSNPIKLSGILEHCKKKGITFNDFLTAVVIESLEKYAGQKLGKINALIPFSLRGQPKDGSFLPLENDLAVFPITFPEVSERFIADCARLYKGLKNSPRPFVVYLTIKLAGLLLPWTLYKAITFFLVNKSTLLFSNVPGPKGGIFYNGRSFKYMISMSPNMSNCGISITSFSYQDDFIVTCYSDKNCIDDPFKYIKITESTIHEYINKLKTS